MILNLVLWGGGALLLLVGALRIRAPRARLQQLDQLDANARRYDAWRGGSRTAVGGPADGRTGADEMRDLLRNQVRLWALAIIAGIVMIVAGFVIR
jgi:hypothetical protein